MPKGSIDIRSFGGIVSAADAHDLSEGFAAHAENIDFVQQPGLFAPLPDDETWAGFGGAYYGKCDKVTLYNDATKGVLVDRAASDSAPTLRVVSLGSTITTLDSASVVRSSWDCAASDGEAVHVGLGPASNAPPMWAGTIFHKQFTGKAYVESTTGLDILEAEVEAADCVGMYISGTTAITCEFPSKSTDTSGNYWYKEEDCNLKIGTAYYYYASLVYDGIQEGPPVLIGVLDMQKSMIGVSNGDDYAAYIAQTVDGAYTWTDISNEWNEPVVGGKPAAGVVSHTFTIRVRKTTGGSRAILNRRVTGINIYRFDNVGGFANTVGKGIAATAPYFDTQEALALGEPSFLKHISVVEDSDWGAALVSGAGSAGVFDESGDTFAVISFTDDYSFGERTFSARAGYSPTIDHMQLHYGVSCVSDGRHIVGRCWHPELKDINSWLFRSQPFKYDIFDWVNDYLVLPSAPNALVSWAGRIYAFCTGRTYVVNPATFDIEDTWEGIGAMHEKGVCTTDRGMFWADDNNLYWHDGSRVNIIGAPILKNQYSANIGWLKRYTSTSHNRAYDPVVAYDARYDSVFFFCVGGDSVYRAFQFHVGTQRWSTITFTATGPFNTAFQMPNGLVAFSVYNSGNDQFYKLMTAATNRSWKWVSAQMGLLAAKTMLYHIYVGYKTARPGTVKFYRNDADYSSGTTISSWTTAVDSSQTDKAELTVSAGVWLSFREFALEISGSAVQDITNMAVIKREITPR